MTATAREAPRPAYLIESVDSALRLLHMFARGDRVRLSEVAEALQVSPSTAHRLLAMLCYHGFATQDHRRREYRPGPALMRVGFAAMKKLDIREVARPIMEALSAELNETIGLGILQGVEVLYMAGIDGTRVVRVGARTGALIPAHCISMGKVLLSSLTEEQLTALFPHEALPVMTDKTVATKAELSTQLAAIRRRGYAQSVGESEEGVASIAVGIFDHGGAMHAAMSVAAPFFRATKANIAEWLPPLRAAAARLGAALPAGA
jgi:IclR family transcriptional regulator, acetate operon repressor